MHPPEPPRHAPIELWRIAREYIVALFNIFGEPQDIAADHTYLTTPYKQLLQWVRTGEALLRLLLLMEASAYDKPDTRPLLRKKRERKRRLVYFYPDKPQDWRVSFRCLLDRRRLAGGALRQAQGDAEIGDASSVSVSLSLSKASVLSSSKGTRPEQRRFHDAWPLALRVEAILRAYNNPAPYARRLARRLYATPHRARAMTRLPPNATRCLFEIEEIRDTALTYLPRFDSG